jgi:hypothetical protein
MSIASLKEYASSFVSVVADSSQKIAKAAVNNPKTTLIALGAMWNLPLAAAGPITYGLCVAGCEAAAIAGTLGAGAGPGLVICFNGCLPLLAPFCP